MASGETFGTDSGVGSTIALLEARLPAARERRSRLEEELAAAVAREDAITSVLEGLRALSGTPLDGRAEPPRDTTTATAPVGAAEAGEAEGAVVEAAGPEVTAASDGQDSAVAGSVEASPAPAEKPARKSTGRKTATRAAARKSTAGKAATATSPAPAGSAPAAASATKKTTARKAAAKGAPKAVAPKDTKPKATKKALPKARKASPSKAATAARKVTVTAASTPSKTASAPGRRRLADAEGVLAVLAQASNPLRAREVVGLLGLDAVDANINAIRTRLERLAKAGQVQRSGRGLYTVAAGGLGAAG